MKDVLTLSDVLTRRMSLQWYEGVAIVRAVVERLTSHGVVQLRVPELHQIELLADGSVELDGGIAVAEPVRRLAQVLQALLNDTEVPVQLRLAISQGTAPLPSYASIAAFDQALAYFERPDRAGILTALYVRAAAAERLETTDHSLTLDSIAPLAQGSESALLMSSHPKHVRRFIAVGLGVAAIVSLATAATLYVRRTGMPVDAREVARVTVVAADAVGAVLMTGVSAVSDSAGLGRLVSAEDDSAPPAGPVEPRLAVLASTKPAPRVSSADVHVPRAVGNVETVGTLVAYEVQTSALTPIATLPEEVLATEGVNPDAAREIYTAESHGVTPPMDVRQQLRHAPPPTVDLSNLSRIQIVIGADGTVESARLLDNRSDVIGGMLLSAIKTWEFYPATKDSVAVRYRKILLVSLE